MQGYKICIDHTKSLFTLVNKKAAGNHLVCRSVVKAWNQKIYSIWSQIRALLHMVSDSSSMITHMIVTEGLHGRSQAGPDIHVKLKKKNNNKIAGCSSFLYTVRKHGTNNIP